MTKIKREFDLVAYYRALDSTVIARKLTWKKVAEQTGVNASTLSRMAKGQRPDASSLAALAAWSGLNPADFVTGVQDQSAPETLARITAAIHGDPRLTPEGATALDELFKSTYQRLAK